MAVHHAAVPDLIHIGPPPAAVKSSMLAHRSSAQAQVNLRTSVQRRWYQPWEPTSARAASRLRPSSAMRKARTRVGLLDTPAQPQQLSPSARKPTWGQADSLQPTCSALQIVHTSWCAGDLPCAPSSHMLPWLAQISRTPAELGGNSCHALGFCFAILEPVSASTYVWVMDKCTPSTTDDMSVMRPCGKGLAEKKKSSFLCRSDGAT